MSEEYVNKGELFSQIEEKLKAQGFTIDHVDQTRPWGGFFVIAEEQAQQFADTYFDGLDVQNLKISGKLSPKILVVRSEEHTSELQSRENLVCRLLLEKKNK